MKRKSTESNRESCCDLRTDARKLAAANRRADAIKDKMPQGLARPALRALAAAGYTTLDQLTCAREADLLRLHGMGPNAVAIIKAALADRGVSLRS
jgi:hypothetical protein